MFDVVACEAGQVGCNRAGESHHSLAEAVQRRSQPLALPRVTVVVTARGERRLIQARTAKVLHLPIMNDPASINAQTETLATPLDVAITDRNSSRLNSS